MRVCVCGAQSLYMRGGAELLHESLVAQLAAAGREVELVRVPTDWSQANLLASAFAWRLLTIRADLVIATNFPSYFVKHPRKVVWLTHQHRAAYDGLGRSWSDIGDTPDALEHHRELVEWDSRVIAEAARTFAISRRVAERLRRFNGLDAEVLYHPPPLFDELVEGESGDYVFCATRLEANKRPGLMIDAMAHAPESMRLVVAGTGSLAEGLRERVAELGLQSRVRLLGYVDDAAIIDLFRHARAVLYVPFDEDYGYVPLQAFHAAKPVVTCADSGGVLEWVRHDVTGVVADPDARAVGAALRRLDADVAWARSLGRAGRRAVAQLSWRHAVDALVG